MALRIMLAPLLLLAWSTLVWPRMRLIKAGILANLLTARFCSPTPPNGLHTRDYFYIGGRYENRTQSAFGAGLVLVEQTYVEHLMPAAPTQKYPLVLWPGAAQTGSNFLNTPDGRHGWASHWLELGYEIFIVDPPERGRSPWTEGNGNVAIPPVEFVQSLFTTTKEFNLWPQARLHTQWAGTGHVGDPTFDQFYASQVQMQLNVTRSAVLNLAAGIALLEKIGSAILVTHSQSGPYGWNVADARPALTKAVLAIEPEGPPFVEEIMATGPARPYGISTLPLTYSPSAGNPPDIPTILVDPPSKDLSSCILQAEPPKRLANLSKIPVLVLTGEASFHAFFEHCTVKYLEQAGVCVQWVNLPDHGYFGNGHFMFMEKNNMDFIHLLDNWLQEVSAN